jgi:PAS domain S-box-containing protein
MILNKINFEKLKSLRILYVEDDAETREELELLLKQRVADLYVASNGAEGFKLFQKYRPDVVITDIQMPVTNGLAMSADIKHLSQEQNIIILSAYNDVEYAFRAMSLGIQHYLTKPINLERLLKLLEKIAEQIQLQSELAKSQKLLQQYRLMVDEQAIVAKFNLDGEVTYVNDRFCLLTGYQKEELIGHFYPFLYQVDGDLEKFLTFLKQLTAKRKWHSIVKNKTKQGKIFVADVIITAIVDDESQVVEYVAMMVDITHLFNKHELYTAGLKKDLDQQKHFLAEYERALDVGSSLCVIGNDGLIQSVNQNFCNSLQCQAEDLVGHSYCDLISDAKSSEGIKNFQQRILNSIERRGHSAELLKLKYDDGPEQTFSSVIVGIKNLQGDNHCFLALSQDITESVRLNDDILETQKEFIYLMGEVVENRSHETGKHLKRVAEISRFLAEKLGMGNEFSEMLRITSPMHDIGKIGISDAILHKPGRLTKNEFEVMKTHSQLGFDILKSMDKPLIQMAARIAHEHHEHFDGSGYPVGLAGEDISIEGRIVALVDVFDALGSKRIYKDPWSDDTILAYIQSKKGRQFDPQLVNLMTEHYDEIIAIRNQLSD